MRVVVFGATGMVGQGALREALLAPDVTAVAAVVRTPTGVRHPKLTEIRHDDFTDLTAIEDRLAGFDACFFCLGVSSVGMDEAAYTRVTWDVTMAAARSLARRSPDLVFVYVSGAGTGGRRQMWARVKARTEQGVLDLFPHGYAVRPGFIQPTYGVTTKTRWVGAMYTVTAPLFPVLRRVARRHVITSDELGRAMLRLARAGFRTRVLESADLVEAGTA